MIKKESVRELKRTSNLVEIVGETVPLQETQSGQYRGPSPFIEGGTLTIDPNLKKFHCVASGLSGDVIDWIAKCYELSFAEAVHLLAAKTGIRLRYDRNFLTSHSSNKARVKNTTHKATERARP